MHFGAAQIFRRSFLADSRLHQRRPRQKQARALGHQDVIAHYRQIRAAGHAHAHNGGQLRNAHRAHHRVVAEHAAEIVGIGKHVLLQRQKYTRRINQINRGNVIVDSNILRADHFLRGHGKKRAGFHRGIIGDDHEGAPADARDSGDGPS